MKFFLLIIFSSTFLQLITPSQTLLSSHPHLHPPHPFIVHDRFLLIKKPNQSSHSLLLQSSIKSLETHIPQNQPDSEPLPVLLHHLIFNRRSTPTQSHNPSHSKLLVENSDSDDDDQKPDSDSDPTSVSNPKTVMASTPTSLSNSIHLTSTSIASQPTPHPHPTSSSSNALHSASPTATPSPSSAPGEAPTFGDVLIHLKSYFQPSNGAFPLAIMISVAAGM